MHFGLIGYGAWGRHHAMAIAQAPGATLRAIACRTERSAAAARRDFPEVPVHLDYHELLARADLDAIDVVVPNHLHAEIGIAALEQGKDVLLEKPMAATREDCDRLIAAARRSGRVLSIGHELRLSSQWGRIKALVDSGEIGQPRYALVDLFRFPFRQGADGWRYARDKVGSWILEEPVHFFDALMWYFERQGDPTSVLAVGSARTAGTTMEVASAAGVSTTTGVATAAGVTNGKGHEATFHHNVTILLRFPDGLYAVVSQTLAGFEYHQVVEVTGTEGSIRAWWSGAMDRTLQPTFELKVQHRGRSQCETVPLEPAGEVFELAAQLAATVAVFRERRPLVSGEEAKKRVVVCLEAERSLREGKEIALTF
jgi:myo-inositol 2-dehydrogenase / D-chiro-inositol 1-dehydrogenase